MNVLETLYHEWCSNLQDNREVEEAANELSKFDEELKDAMKDNCFDLDCAIFNFASVSQKQGFMGGFEVARQLFLGGNL